MINKMIELLGKNTNKNDYNLYIDLLKRTVEIEGERCFLDSIDKFIVERNKKVINELEKTRITKPVIEILKKCNQQNYRFAR